MIVWHKHHIVPRHAGGTNDRSNILKCNIPMHAMLHKIRYEETGDEYDRIAYQALSGQVSVTQAEIDARKEGNSRGGKALKGKPKSPEHIEKLRVCRKLKGSEHPNARAVITPNGIYDTVEEAAMAEGIPRKTASSRLARGSKGWYYE